MLSSSQRRHERMVYRKPRTLIYGPDSWNEKMKMKINIGYPRKVLHVRKHEKNTQPHDLGNGRKTRQSRTSRNFKTTHRPRKKNRTRHGQKALGQSFSSGNPKRKPSDKEGRKKNKRSEQGMAILTINAPQSAPRAPARSSVPAPFPAASCVAPLCVLERMISM